MIYKNRKQLSIILKEVGINSTSHGIPNILRSEKTPIKFMWSIFTLIATGLCSLLVIQSINKFYEFEVITKIRQINDFSAIFPTLTVCSLDFFDNITLLNFIYTKANFKRKESNPKIEFLIHRTILIHLNLTINELKNLGLSQNDETFIDCSYESKTFNKNNLNFLYHPFYGNCYQFNSNQNELKSTTRTGKFQGFEITFNLGKKSEINSKGAVIFIHNNSALISHDNEITLMPNSENNIRLKRTYIYQKPKPYSSCDANTDKPDAYNSEFFKLIHKNNLQYSQTLCVDICFQKLLHEKCDCFDAFIPAYYNSKICTNFTCIGNEYHEFPNSNYLKETCLANCPLECDKMEYNTFISTNQYTHYNLSNEYNLVKINVYYETLSYTKIEEVESQNLVALLSNIGGIAGLFLGISVLSFAELIEILVQILIAFKEKLSNKIENC